MRGVRVYLAANPPQAEIVKDYLGGHGIAAEVRDQHLWGGVGELPADSYPSVWVLNESEHVRARELVEAFERGETGQRTIWHCSGCGERLGGQFTDCWNCGQPRPTD